MQPDKVSYPISEVLEIWITRWLKYLAPKILRNNGDPASCECTDDFTCAQCAVAACLFFEGEGIKTKADLEKLAREAGWQEDPLISTLKKLRNKRNLAKKLDIDKRTLRRWIAAGRIPAWHTQKVSRVLDELFSRDHE